MTMTFAAPLPAQYAWLPNYVADGHPAMLVAGLSLYGLKEKPGAGDNPIILGWAKEVGAADYKHDETPWCGLFMAHCAKAAGYDPPSAPLWALNWGRFGQSVVMPSFGDVLAFIRPGGGHVGFYIGEDAAAYHVLGGNQGDSVGFARVEKTRLRAARRPAYKLAPSQVHPVMLSASGALSSNEA